MIPISAYVLTKNSEKHLAEILQKLHYVADEILVIDSGSTDATEKIAKQLNDVTFLLHPFANFKEQRLFAERTARHDMILFLDCDEVPDHDFVVALRKMKSEGFHQDAYAVKRTWWVLGKQVHTIYPVMSPDFPVRLYNRNVTSFQRSPIVHEMPEGHTGEGVIAGNVRHYTFETEEELQQKLELYTDLAARDLVQKKKPIHFLKQVFSPPAAWFKWYFVKKGYKDGWLGFQLSRYAFNYTRKKYIKAAQLLKAG
ncbi:MAG: glycosyltransferase family 2 protein [Chitinophagales bacterium]